jgi:hypothetical protein
MVFQRRQVGHYQNSPRPSCPLASSVAMKQVKGDVNAVIIARSSSLRDHLASTSLWQGGLFPSTDLALPPAVQVRLIAPSAMRARPMEKQALNRLPEMNATELTSLLKDHFDSIGGMADETELAIARELVRRARLLEKVDGMGHRKGV